MHFHEIFRENFIISNQRVFKILFSIRKTRKGHMLLILAYSMLTMLYSKCTKYHHLFPDDRQLKVMQFIGVLPKLGFRFLIRKNGNIFH